MLWKDGFRRDGVNGFSLCLSASARARNAQCFSAHTEVAARMKARRGRKTQTLVDAVDIVSYWRQCCWICGPWEHCWPWNYLVHCTSQKYPRWSCGGGERWKWFLNWVSVSNSISGFQVKCDWNCNSKPNTVCDSLVERLYIFYCRDG